MGEYIIWNINNVGYLSCETDLIAENLDVDVETVEKVLSIIQRFDPPGIGARNLQECLLIQLLDQDNPNDLAVKIIREHFDDFKNKRFEKIARKLSVSIDDCKKILDKITQLNPKPGSGYLNLFDDAITPDVIVEKDGDDFKITLNDWNIPHLRINNQYKNLLLDKKKTSKKTK